MTDDVGSVTGALVSGGSTDDTTPTLSGTAEAGSTISVFDGTTLLGTTTADASGNWTFTPAAGLGEGTHAITVTATDASGNV
ncbi:Ig-like domain-containing protein, partial [Burkholderia multivorans]|uniref:Ig-like domain-containing protein n=1 Tax=Burkholderia multivorans TaxID=87883 RepID=UPI001EFA1E77